MTKSRREWLCSDEINFRDTIYIKDHIQNWMGADMIGLGIEGGDKVWTKQGRMEEREGVDKGGGQSKGWERGGVMEAEGGMMRFP